jgi:hypothetical protein
MKIPAKVFLTTTIESAGMGGGCDANSAASPSWANGLVV